MDRQDERDRLARAGGGMILETIVAGVRRRLVERKLATPLARVSEQAQARRPLDMLAALRGPGVSIIAEIKRASPSKGTLNASLQPAALALSYARAGAAAISVLTEEDHFHGSLADLDAVQRALAAARPDRSGASVRSDLTGPGDLSGLKGDIPLLRKDFIVDEYQVYEARAYGASAVLLIAAVLNDDELAQLFAVAQELSLTPLIEVHNEDELARALRLQPPLIGVNNRNLHDFTVDLGVTLRLRPLIPEGTLVVSESGVSQASQMRELAALRVDAVLIGEALVRAAAPALLLAELWEAGQ